MNKIKAGATVIISLVVAAIQALVELYKATKK